MSVTIEELAQRVEAMEREITRLLIRARPGRVPASPPRDGSILEWYAEVRRDNASRGTLAERRRHLGIPEDLEPMEPAALRDMLLAEGIRPEERLASSEIIRMREE